MKKLNKISWLVCAGALALATSCTEYNPFDGQETANIVSEESTDDLEDVATTFDDTTTGSPYFTTRGLVCSYNSNINTTGVASDVNLTSIEGLGTLISWRWLQSDGNDATYNVYRDGTLLNSTPLTVTNYKDYNIVEGTSYTYKVTDAATGTELASTTFTPQSGIFYKSIPVNNTGLSYSYENNDCAVGDLDGDGEYEIVLKRYVVDQARDNLSTTKQTGSPLLEAYKTDGTFLWRVDLGVNICQGQHYTPFVVYDFTGDGKAEIAVRTAEGTTFGDGTTIGDENGDGITDYRDSSGYVLDGPEYLSLINGADGSEICRNVYIPRGDQTTWESYWGDSYGNRIDRFLMAAAHLNGQDNRASIIICRGYYVNYQVWAYHYQNGKLVPRWRFNTTDEGNESYAGNGNHNIMVADVDNDGNDEIFYGSAAFDHDGTGLWCSGLGHGDAMHLGKFSPNLDGLQLISCKEEESDHGGKGVVCQNAASGSILSYISGSGDVGRCMAADIYPDSPGAEYWGSTDSGQLYSVETGQALGVTAPTQIGGGVSYNFGIWWSGDLRRQLFDGNSNGGNTIVDYYYGRLFMGGDFDSRVINDSKANPCFMGDIWGDWREELILTTTDYSELRIFTTDFAPDYRIHPLMEDHVYRLGAAVQNVGYNQPPHTGFYLGPDQTSYND